MNNNYIPLYRKYRPQTIEQIVGQEHIKKALANAIEMDRISHAYLFTGSRGTGKTSTARIFAKSLNCEHGPTISPCNECENCRNITNSIPIDVIEIDAASNRSVNDADEIIQKVAIAPVQSRYKIYIIDEVHMLTPQAFNALLKTLEEPPKNVIFILATTEVHKVLDTIKSRCQRFDFKRITTDDISKHLRYISDCENINITDNALRYIAQNSAGGMRDSIALLDQLSVLSSADAAIDVDDINRLLGRLSFGSLSALFDEISTSNQSKALEVLTDIYNKGNEPIQILSNFLEYLRNALIVKSTDVAAALNIIQMDEAQIQQLSEKVKGLETHQLVSLIDKCSSYIKELKQSVNPKLWLDVSILDMANLVENTKLEDLQKRITALESGEGTRLMNISAYNTPPSPVSKHIQQVKAAISQNIAQITAAPAPAPKVPVQTSKPSPKTAATEDEVLNNPVPMSKPAADSGIKNLWVKLLENISSVPSKAILKQQALPVKITQEEVIISIKNPNWLKQFAPDGNKHSYIVEAVNTLFSGGAKKIIVRAPEKGDDALRKEQPSSQDEDKPAPPAQKEIPQKQQVVKEKNEGFDKFSQQKQTPSIKSETAQKIPEYKKTQNADPFHSDEVNMIVDLFDGKFIE